MLIPFGVFSAGGVATGNSYELIQTISITTTGVTTIDFQGIPQTYKHLQMRFTYQVNAGSGEYGLVFLPNSDGSTTDNAFHWLYGNGSSVSSTSSTGQALGNRGIVPYPQPESTGQSINASAYQSQFLAGIIDLLDYTSTTKNKTTKSFSGFSMGGGNNVTLSSQLWTDTTAVNRIFMYCKNGPQFTVGTRFSLYGIRG